MGNARTCLHVDGQTEYSRCQGYVLYLVGPVGCGVLWVVKTEWKLHKGSVSNAIDSFEPSIEGETATIIPRRSRQSYSTAWQCSTICHHTGQDILGNAKMGGLTPPVVLSRRCSTQLLFVSIDETRPGSSVFPLLWRSQKMDLFVNHLKRHRFFRDGICQLPERWKNLVTSDGQYFES